MVQEVGKKMYTKRENREDVSTGHKIIGKQSAQVFILDALENFAVRDVNLNVAQLPVLDVGKNKEGYSSSPSNQSSERPVEVGAGVGMTLKSVVTEDEG